MLWAIGSSAFVIYLYRKLSSEQNPEAADSAGSNSSSAIELELAKLNERIGSLESRLTKGGARVIAS
jgi:hypothetical protein